VTASRQFGPPGRGEPSPAPPPAPPGRRPRSATASWWQSLGFWHGVALGSLATVLVIALFAAISWVTGIRAPTAPVWPQPESGDNSEAPESRPAESKEERAVSSPSAGGDPEPVDDFVGLISALQALPTEPSSRPSSYDRAQFGQTWADIDRNGCDTRNDILRRDLIDAVIKDGTGGCKVLEGVLDDPYSGQIIGFRSGPSTSLEVQIDHVVPLAWAWRQGAGLWSESERAAFANDPLNLLAVEGYLNQQKSDSGPAYWLPPDRGFHCEYSERFALVLVSYQLALPVPDRDTLVVTLESC
jgi:hypothetical protein